MSYFAPGLKTRFWPTRNPEEPASVLAAAPAVVPVVTASVATLPVVTTSVVPASVTAVSETAGSAQPVSTSAREIDQLRIRIAGSGPARDLSTDRAVRPAGGRWLHTFSILRRALAT